MEPLPATDAPPTALSPSKPSQIKFTRPAMMALFARVTTFPPLGQVTVVPPSRKQFFFSVVIESSQSLPDQPWEVSIWYDHGSYSYSHSPWRALDLQRTSTSPTILYDERPNKTHRYTFEGSLPSPFPDNGKTYNGRKVPFTVRYRTEPNTEWQWVSDNFGVGDGEVILQPPIDPNFLGVSPVELKQGWYARKLSSEAPGARLYVMESIASIPVPDEGDAREECVPLGYVSNSCRWMALVRIWSPWLAPRHGDKHFRLTEPAILLTFLKSDGSHVVLLAVNGVDDCITTFKSDDSGNIVISARNDTGKDRKFKVLAATAWTFEVANAAVMYEMRKLVRQSTAYQQVSTSLLHNVRAESVDSDTVLVSTDDNRDPVHDDTPTPNWLASWYDSLAYCTWNSLGQDLTAERIMHGLDSFAENKIYIANLIIDDNWQSLTGEQGETSQFERAWTDFEANPKGFPEGLKAAVDKIRAAHPRIRDIAVWHALMGYWGGVSNDTGTLHKDYKLRQVTLQGTKADGVKHVVDPADIHRMYDDFYSFLTKCGITAVKTDVQFYLDLLASTTDRRDMTVPYQSAWTQAHLRHLSGKAISCMSQIPQILYHSFLPTNTPRIMLRNSDDFFPDVPTSHPWHVFANAHSALFVQHLNVLPDWDMFQTAHQYSGFHAASRCVSGGPIYITDTPGEHDVDLIRQMTATSPRGETIVLRPSNVAKTLGVYNKYDDGAPLVLGTYDGRAETGTGIIGVFNISEHEATTIIPVGKIPGVTATEVEKSRPTTPAHTPRLAPTINSSSTKRRWIVRSHQSRRITKPIAPTIPPQADSLLEVTLSVRGYDVWSAIPVHGPFSTSSAATSASSPTSPTSFSVAIVGLLGKMTGSCAIVDYRFILPNSANENPNPNTKEDETEDASSDQYVDAASRLRIEVSLKALGTLGVWLSDASVHSTNDLLVLIKGQAIPQSRVKITTEGVDDDTDADADDLEAETNVDSEGVTASNSKPRARPGLLEIDVEGAWTDLSLDPGWGNEVTVEILMP